MINNYDILEVSYDLNKITYMGEWLNGYVVSWFNSHLTIQP